MAVEEPKDTIPTGPHGPAGLGRRLHRNDPLISSLSVSCIVQKLYVHVLLAFLLKQFSVAFVLCLNFCCFSARFILVDCKSGIAQHQRSESFLSSSILAIKHPVRDRGVVTKNSLLLDPQCLPPNRTFVLSVLESPA